MNLIARARRYLSTSRRAARRAQDDPADMGTAFGLDAITTIQPESPAESAARERALAVEPHGAAPAPPLDLLGAPAQTSSTRRGWCASASPRRSWPRALQTTRVGRSPPSIR